MPALPHHKGILVGEIGKSDFPVFGKMPVVVVYLHQYGFAGGGGVLCSSDKFARLPNHHPWVSPAAHAHDRWVFHAFLDMLHTVHFVQGFALYAVGDRTKFRDIDGTIRRKLQTHGIGATHVADGRRKQIGTLRNGSCD